MDASYLDRLVTAYTELLKRERRTDLDFAEITRRVSAILGRIVPSQTVGRWMKGRVQPREAAERKAFAEALGTDYRWLFYAEPYAEKPAVGAGLVDVNDDVAKAQAAREAAKKAAKNGGRRQR